MAEATLREYANTRKKRGGPKCVTCELPAELLREVNESMNLVADERVSNQAISEWLDAKGFVVSAGALRNHRNGGSTHGR